MPFQVGDRLDICDFSIELGYLEEESAKKNDKGAGPKRPRTMLIDHSVMAQAAYVDGDFENVRSASSHMALGKPGTSAEERKADTGEYEVQNDGESAPRPKKRGDGRVIRQKRKSR